MSEPKYALSESRHLCPECFESVPEGDACCPVCGQLLFWTSSELDRLKAENAELRAKVNRLEPLMTLVACELCGRGVRARDTRGGLCIDCIVAQMGGSFG